MLTLAAGPLPPPPGFYATDRGTLARLRAALCELRVDGVSPTLYDDLEAVLGEYAEVGPAELPGLMHRLDGTLAELLSLLPFSANPVPRGVVDRVVTLIGASPEDPKQAIGLLRQIAVAVLDIADRLTAEPEVQR